MVSKPLDCEDAYAERSNKNVMVIVLICGKRLYLMFFQFGNYFVKKFGCAFL